MANMNYETKMELLKECMPERYKELKALERSPEQIASDQKKFEALMGRRPSISLNLCESPDERFETLIKGFANLRSELAEETNP